MSIRQVKNIFNLTKPMYGTFKKKSKNTRYNKGKFVKLKKKHQLSHKIALVHCKRKKKIRKCR